MAAPRRTLCCSRWEGYLLYPSATCAPYSQGSWCSRSANMVSQRGSPTGTRCSSRYTLRSIVDRGTDVWVCACLTKQWVGGWRFVAGRCGLRNHSSKRHQPVPGGHPWTGNVQERWNQLHHPPHNSDTERYYLRRTVSKTGIPTGQQSRLQRKNKVPAQETTTTTSVQWE